MNEKTLRILLWSLIVLILLVGGIFAVLTSPIMLLVILLLLAIALLIIKIAAPNIWEVLFPQREHEEKGGGKSFEADRILEKSDGSGGVIRITKPTFELGRARGNDYMFPDSQTSVSRKHCRIYWDEKSHLYYIVDLGSKMGTFVNQERLTEGEPKLLSEGSVVRISDQSFFFRKVKH